MHSSIFSAIPLRRALSGMVFILIFFSINPASAQHNDKDFFLYGNFIYSNNIQTVLFNQEGFELSDPLIRLNSNDMLVLSFDDLDGGYKNYDYTIIHCDAHWQPSELSDFEYIDGFYQDQITDYYQSVNTRVSFTHYRLEFPNHSLKPIKSGNYILKVFLNGDRDQVVLTRKFMVFEQQVAIAGQVEQANLVRYRDRMQQLSFSIQPSGVRISNPYRDLRVVITQNGRWDNAITNIEPRSVRGELLVYDYEEELLFRGGNEFRRFDIRSLRQLSENVEDIRSSRRFWDVFLREDKPRSYQPYVSDRDINGRYQIITRDGRNHLLESDYAWVHFRLPMANPLPEGHIYVMGELTDWHFSEEGRMNYNYGENAYELSVLLKQGYYNYLYAVKPEGSIHADVEVLEGSHSVTENSYTIYVYYREPGSLYDRLLGVRHLNSSVY